MIDIVLWIIAACEIIRAIQNAVQLNMARNNNNAYSDFVKTLKASDREFMRLLEECEGETGNEYAAKRADIEPSDKTSQHNAD